MQYSEVRPTLRTGDILVWSNQSWGSFREAKIQAIRLFTMSEYSHVGICVVQNGRVWVLEAVEPCARLYPLSKMGDFYHIPMNLEWSDNAESAALSHVGAEYRQLKAIKAYWSPHLKGRVDQCAAMVLTIMMADGVYLGDRATPAAVVKAAQKLGHPTYYITNQGNTK